MEVNGKAGGELAASQGPRATVRGGAWSAAFGTWLGQAGLPFLLVTYLGLRGGGYDEIVRSEVGIAAWWIVLLGAAAGALPLARLTRASWLALGLLAAFAAWTGLSIAWSESAESSAAELGRVASLLGILALALSVQDRDGLRRMVAGVGAAVALVAGVALLSRLHPAWFPELEAPRFLPDTQARLHYPLNYWNGLAAFVAIGIPLLLAMATIARHTAARALALAAVPALALTALFTLSRGGAAELVVGLAVLFALHPRRLFLAGNMAIASLGTVILIAAADQRPELMDGLGNSVAASQGDEMLAMTLVVCCGVGLIAVAAALAERHQLGPRMRLSRRAAGIAGVAAAVIGLGIALAAGAPGSLADRWDEFKDPVFPDAGLERFDSASGSGRYQFWEAAVDAGKTEPLVGIGPGTYEYYWAREGALPTFVRDAHSLYLETFAELGIVGALLIVALVASPFALGTRRLLSKEPAERVLVAGALGACAAFAVAAAIDWAWELTVLPVAFLLLAAAVIARPSTPTGPATDKPGSGLARAAPVVLALLGMVAIGIPMAAATAVRESQADVRAEDLAGALGKARTARDIEPYAATPLLQQALVLELQGDLDRAAALARAATEDEPTNWRTWLVLSRLEAQAGHPEESVAAYREARDLNPRSALFE